MTSVYCWDEVSGVVSLIEVALAPTDTPSAQYEVISEALGDRTEEPTGYELHTITELPELTLVTGRYGHDRQFACWWGAEEQAQAMSAIFC